MAILNRSDKGPVACLEMNRPGALNALSDDMLAALRDAYVSIAADPSIRVVILSGAGKAFCAGHDLKEITAGRAAPDGGAAYFADLFDRCSEVMQMITTMPQPVIAKVHGVAAAAGCQLVASCDLAVAAEDARFAVNGVNIGLFCSTPMVALSRNIGRKKTFEMLVTGDMISAEEAKNHGLINRFVPTADLDAETLALAEQIAGKLGKAVKIGKRAYYDQIQMPLDQAYRHTGDAIVENLLDMDTAEGIQAFIEKRDPDWTQ